MQIVPLTIRSAAIVLILSKGRTALIDCDDWLKVGVLRWSVLSRLKQKSEYAIRTEYCGGKKTTIYLHREIMGFPAKFVDHVNRNGLDCRNSNLRVASRSQNGANRLVRRRDGLKLHGVSFRNRRHPWQAQIVINKKLIYLGSHQTAEDAARAYDAAAKAYFGKFAVLNFKEAA